MNKRILAALLALLVAFACASAWAEPADAVAEDAAVAGETSEDGEVPEEGGEPQPARGYVLVSTATQSGWLPLPDEGEYSYSLKQMMSDGTEVENVIHLTPDGVYMEDSTCENHDCVEQGTVTLENRDERILSNMIICLPNQVFLQLFTPDEVLAMVQEAQEQGE